MTESADRKKEIIIWVDSDPNVAKETIIKNAGYNFIYFGDTQQCIDYFKKNIDKERIVGLITSTLKECAKNGPAMIDEIMLYKSSMQCVPVVAICSVSTTQHHWIKIITNCRADVQNKLLTAIQQNKPVNDEHKKQECGAADCKENHSSHYCRLCDTEGSNHRAMKCPKGKSLYHGEFVPIISKSVGQLRASTGGRLGKGVYFTDEYEKAEIIAMNWKKSDNQNGGCVFEVTVNLGKMKDIGKAGDDANSWHKEYDSCYGLHPPWLSFKDGECKEYCIKDPNKTRICSVTLIDAHIDADIFAPRLTIKLKGNSSINEDRISGEGWNIIKI
eukprot:332495_1